MPALESIAMRWLVIGGARLAVAVIGAAILSLLAAAALAASPGFKLEKVSDGVYAAIRNNLPGLGADGTSVFIINGDDVVVVDTTGSLAGAKEEIAALKTLTSKPVRYVVNTHWHFDHTIGNQAWRDAFPNVEFIDQQLTLHRGRRTIEIRQLGRGHTRGDLVVWLPEERIAISGDLVVWPVPLMGSDQSFIGDWSVTLEKLRALQPKAIIPGHGPVMRDDSYVTLLIRLTKSITEQTAAAVARGETLEQARKSVKLDELRQAIAGDDRLLRFIFRVYVANAGVAAAYREAAAAR